MLPIPGASPDNPPGWNATPVAPKTLADLAEFLAQRLSEFRDFPKQCTPYTQVVQRIDADIQPQDISDIPVGGLVFQGAQLVTVRPNPSLVPYHLTLARQASDNAIRWLDHHGIVTGVPDAVTDADDIRTAERKLRDLMKFVTERAKGTPGKSAGRDDGDWFREAPPDGSRYKHGPVETTIKLLMAFLKQDRKTLRKNNGRSTYWIRKLTGNKFAVWFDSPKKYAEVNAGVLQAGQSGTKRDGAGRNGKTSRRTRTN